MSLRIVVSVSVITAVIAGCAAARHEDGRGRAGGPPARNHTATESEPLNLVPATQTAGVAMSDVTMTGDVRTISANGIPDHLVGRFPNRGNPHAISEQNIDLTVSANPEMAGAVTSAKGWVFGVSLGGVVFDPFAAEFWQGNRNSGWTYEALGGAVTLGLDENHGHVQPGGIYHYHGVPLGLLELLRYDENQHSPLVGYAADGFPIYALTGVINSQLTQVTSSYQ